ncbi:MAG: ArsR family transcriptional regulator [Chloroflexi bacterium RBG_19FT_COMBO_55_16]|nr:MAG: ArsR family transcriptional regulator [Chloroflexi bacterium RBG_19FT_COMBO_55_16]
MENILLTDDLLRFFKALSDVNRLKILGLLAQESLSVEQLAEMLNLRPSTVSHHLSRLSEAGLVSARASSYYNLYQLESKALEVMAQRLLAKETLPAVAADVDMDAYDRKVITDYTLADGHLKTIPTQRKKLDAVLRYIAESFEPGSHYTEKQVNEILARYHQDTAFLRRSLVEARLLGREKSGSDYWLVQD